ncbi:MAG: ferritin-like domain-containing protein [Mycobacteriaceae bacterium]|nr:ferritin-like domain-containing protein [Mycobacteriaceae bacterium]
MTSPEQTTTPRPKNPDDAALADAIIAEHATIYGYGFVSAHSTEALNRLVSDCLSDHRELREAAIATLSARSVTPPVAALGYQLPMPVNNPTDAARLAVQMEDDDTVAWRAVLEQAQSAQDRDFAVKALTQCAVRAARWRQVLQAWPVTTPFPGGTEKP